MNRVGFVLVSLCLILAVSPAFGQRTGAAVATARAVRTFTAADYERAEKMLGYSTGQFIDRGNLRDLRFLPDGRFTYNVLTPTGREYVLINPADGSRQTAGDPAGLGITPPSGGGGGLGRRNAAEAVVSPDGKSA